MASAVRFSDLPDEGFAKLPNVEAVTGKSKPAIYAAAKQGRFPPPIKIGGSRSSGFRVGELRKWLADPCAYRAPGFEGGAA